ncbi:MAG: hypothetical protein LBH14_01250 [Desulfobulbaceae bacterium]|jgi:hypothetical protein|nr:hypothetical protein [Desulfobulbaceae bacterium]
MISKRSVLAMILFMLLVVYSIENRQEMAPEQKTYKFSQRKPYLRLWLNSKPLFS